MERVTAGVLAAVMAVGRQAVRTAECPVQPLIFTGQIRDQRGRSDGSETEQTDRQDRQIQQLADTAMEEKRSRCYQGSI